MPASSSSSFTSSSSSTIAVGTRSITLRRYGQEKANLSMVRMTPYRMRVEIVDPVNVSKYLFLFRRNPIDAAGEVLDDYIANSSVIDMTWYPQEDPDPLRSNQFFRLDYFDIYLPSVTTAAELWAWVKEELAFLLEALDASDALELQEEVTIP